MADDVRLKNHGLAPKSAADFTFLPHGFHFLKDGYMVEESRCAVCGESCETECSCCSSTIPVKELSD